jgi:hypothetical protein
VQRQRELSEIVQTLRALGRPANAAGRREHKADQDGNDGDDDKNFEEGQSVAR